MKQSVFVQQQGVECDFTGSTPWVILSPIEQSIKQKIEAVGTPLKDWDINIYRGVLTGYNDAFIIDTEKREAILANCQTEEERKRTAELTRPYTLPYYFWPHKILPIADAVLCFKPLIVSLLASLDIFAVDRIGLACLLQSFFAK